MTEQEFAITCQGRDNKQKLVLEQAVDVILITSLRQGGTVLSTIVECEHNGGGHGQKCYASNPPGRCPYNIDLPHAIDKLYK